jgi:hypothetical protein
MDCASPVVAGCMALKTLVFTFRNAPAPVQIVLASMGCASAVGAAVWMKRCYSVSAEEGSTSGALHPNEFRRFKLREIERISYNTARYRFDLPKSDDVLGLTVASCLVVRAPIGENGQICILVRGVFFILIYVQLHGIWRRLTCPCVCQCLQALNRCS